MKPYSQWSPYLEKCCLLLSSNESYQHASEDIEVLTGMKVSRGTQQRLVQRHEFELPTVKEVVEEVEEIEEMHIDREKVPSHECELPTVKAAVEEMSIDGGKVRLRTPLGQPCEWRDYKAVNLHEWGVAAFFRDNGRLVEWVNQQPLANPLVSLGDGHDGVWNLFALIGPTTFRLEILDWYHLMENLEKVGGSSQRLARVKALLWSGKVEAALKEFDDWDHPRVDNFRTYVTKHRHRIVNYGYYQAEGMQDWLGRGGINY